MGNKMSVLEQLETDLKLLKHQLENSTEEKDIEYYETVIEETELKIANLTSTL